MASLLLKNIDTVVTCDDADSVLRNVSIYIDDRRIVSVLEKGAVLPEADRVIDCTGLWLYPGFVNTHHHLYQYFTRNLPQVQNMELFDWLVTLYEIWKKLDPEVIRLSTLCGLGELMKYGCTTSMDHHYVFPGATAQTLIDTQLDAAKELGMRFTATRGSMSLSKKDGGLPPDSVVQELEPILKDSVRLIEAYHDPAELSMRQIALAPCSPFSVTADLLRESAKLARQYGVRLHTHLCETKDEERYTLEKTGLRPLAYMESLGFIGSDVWYAHGIHFNDEELQLLAQTQTGVAHCPCSNMKLSSGVCRVPDMLRLGVPLGLAVDGSASNDASNMMEEIRTAYLLHRLTYGASAPTGYTLLKMATRGSAKLLGREDIGQIKPGLAADLFMIDGRDLSLAGAEQDPACLFGTVGYHKPVEYCVVNGKVTVEHGALTAIVEEKTLADSRAAVWRLLT
ncbi:MAG: 8-oxoguanine deaminase [Eubacteriales bacterium]|nr:8-oxoguanine deaminase [Eubacteriales bacterium]